MATEQLLFGGVAIGSIFTDSIGANQFIRLNGNTVNSSNSITNVADNGVSYFGVAELKVGMKLISSGPFPTKVTITNITGTSPNATITVDGVASSSETTYLLRVDPGPGQAFIESGSLTFPSGQTDINASSVTGSNDTEYVAGDLEWAVAVPLGKDGSLSTQRFGQFAQFSLFDVQSRPGGATGGEANFFVTASGGDMNGFPAGFDWYATTSTCVLYQIGESNKVGPIFQGSDVGASNDFGFAPGQILAGNLLNSLITSSTATFPYTGSAQILGDLSVTGSSKILLDTSENFLISKTSAPSQSLFNINDEGVATFRLQPDGTIPTAVAGGLYFTTASAYIGIQ